MMCSITQVEILNPFFASRATIFLPEELFVIVRTNKNLKRDNEKRGIYIDFRWFDLLSTSTHQSFFFCYVHLSFLFDCMYTRLYL
jgi:hypothetical protein